MEISETRYRAEKKQEILIYIENFRRWSGGKSPTYAEIGRKIGIDAATVKGYYINGLIRDGWLKTTRRKARSLIPTRPANEYPIPDGDDVSA